MFMTLKRPCVVLNGEFTREEFGLQVDVSILPGRHEIERIPNPRNLDGYPSWLVLKGTKIGAAEGHWRDQELETEEFHVLIEE